MQFAEYRFEDLPNIMAENNRLLSAVKVLLEEANMPQKAQSDLLSIKEASELLNFSIATVYTKVSKKELPFSKRGKRLYFSRIDLLDFVKAGSCLTNEEVKQAAVQKAATAMNKRKELI